MKQYFKDMETNKKIEIILNVDDLRYDICNRYYEELMEQQLEEGQLMLGKDSSKYIDIRDNYDSFYLVLKDWNKFLDNLDKDYLCDEGIKLYDEIYKLYEKYNNEEMYSDRFYNLEEKLENKCKDLLKICEKQLHEYEDYSNEDLKDWLRFEIEENNLFEDLYILDNDINKVYEDITKTYK